MGRRSAAVDRVPPPPGRGAVRGAVIGFVSVTAAVTLLATWTGYEPAESLLMGLFVGSWGGCGFGAMLGGTISFIRVEDRERAELAAQVDPDGRAEAETPGKAPEDRPARTPVSSATR